MTAPISGLKYKVKARVTEQQIKIDFDTEYFIRFDTAIRKAKGEGKVRVVEGKETREEPPMLANVTMLDDGTQGVLLVPTVLRKEITDFYPNDAYVHKMFRIVKHRLEGRRYFAFEIAEIETDGEVDESTEHFSTVEEIEPSSLEASKASHHTEIDAASTNFNEDAGLPASE